MIHTMFNLQKIHYYKQLGQLEDYKLLMPIKS